MRELSQEQASAKLELLDELLREAIDGGHRVLIFSQFVSMLQTSEGGAGGGGNPVLLPGRADEGPDGGGGPVPE